MHGWADALPKGIGDATPAVFVALVMFAIPGGKDGQKLLNWKLVQVNLISFLFVLENHMMHF